MNYRKEFPLWLYILFPGLSMLLGWGLRGYIGGGPFGAMIPGAMVALCISMLLGIPAKYASIIAVFGVVGIGLGGEMTYGQTLGFLLKPETVWWGTTGTFVKGSIWGLLGGIVLSLGLLHNRLSGKIITISFLLLLAGMLAGFKLINQPMVIYFSDRFNPRPETWAALLLGAMAMLIFLAIRLDKKEFRIISRFALLGLISGGLGFGLGGFWMVLGSRLPHEIIFQNWWKCMEFTFGLLLGSGLGYATWLSRKEIIFENEKTRSEETGISVLTELTLTLVIGLAVFWFLPLCFEQIADAGRRIGKFTLPNQKDLAFLLSNYAFYGLIMVTVSRRFAGVAWQIAITLTFCHTVIDLLDDVFPDTLTGSAFTLPFLLVFILTLALSVITAMIQRRSDILRNMFLLLTWSCMMVAFMRLSLNTELFTLKGISACEFICGRFFVHLIFTISALVVSWISVKKFMVIYQS